MSLGPSSLLGSACRLCSMPSLQDVSEARTVPWFLLSSPGSPAWGSRTQLEVTDTWAVRTKHAARKGQSEVGNGCTVGGILGQQLHSTCIRAIGRPLRPFGGTEWHMATTVHEPLQPTPWLPWKWPHCSSAFIFSFSKLQEVFFQLFCYEAVVFLSFFSFLIFRSHNWKSSFYFFP